MKGVEARKKAQATKRAKSERFASQKIQIDKEWKIQRADELNWEIRFKGRFYGFYGTIFSALSALPAKMLGEAAKNSLAELTESQKAIVAKIERAIP